MAGDWIKFEHATPDKPEVVRIAAILEIDQDAVIGKLLRLWIWADQQSVDGNALIVTTSFLDRITFCQGFAVALRQVGWLDGRDGHLLIPNFDRHNGQSSKQRANTAKRVKKSRQKTTSTSDPPALSSNAKRNGTSVTQSLPEKRREENINPPPTPPEFVPGQRPEWEKAAAVEISRLGIDDTSCLKGAINGELGEDDVREIIAYFCEHQTSKGWRPEALHYRLRKAIKGIPVERGWPNASADASKEDARKKDEERRQQQAREKMEKAKAAQLKKDREKLEYKELEAKYGNRLDCLTVAQQRELALQVSSVMEQRIAKEVGASSEFTRRAMFRQLQKEDDHQAGGA